MANSKDVAALAGTSQTTVSRVFRGMSGIHPHTAERVREAAAKLNYEPNEAARALIAGRTGRIALVVERLTHPAFALIADLTHQALLDRDYRVSILESDSPKGGLQESTLKFFNGVDGVIFASATRDFDMRGLLRRIRRPVVSVLRVGYPIPEESPVDAVYPDHEMGAELAVAHLWDLGHRKIGLLGATRKYTAGFATEKAFRNAMDRRGIASAELSIAVNELGYDAGMEDALRMLRSPRSVPTALFAPDDLSAYGAIDAARQLGLTVPHQLSVVGFDDFDMSAWKSYDLTTVKISHEQLVNISIRRLMDRINGAPHLERDPAARIDCIPVHLVERNSTAPPTED